VEVPKNSRIAAALAGRVAGGSDATQIAGAIVSTWQEIDAALTPVLGHQGVAALYKRSLYLTAAACPWLAGTFQGAHAPMDLAELKSAFELQSAGDAAAGGGELLQTFHELLASLVGPALTERLLRSVWQHLLSGAPAQDT
jgi:hypothetical protein